MYDGKHFFPKSIEFKKPKAELSLKRIKPEVQRTLGYEGVSEVGSSYRSV
jgi:hypothetical protein